MAALLDKKLVDKVERLKADANRSLMEKRPIEACGIYWHMVDFLWVIIFALLYVMR